MATQAEIMMQKFNEENAATGGVHIEAPVIDKPNPSELVTDASQVSAPAAPQSAEEAVAAALAASAAPVTLSVPAPQAAPTGHKVDTAVAAVTKADAAPASTGDLDELALMGLDPAEIEKMIAATEGAPAPTGQEGEGTPAAADPKAPVPSVPLPRLQEEAEKRRAVEERNRQLELENARLQGRQDVLTAPAPQAPAAPQVTAEQVVGALNGKIKAVNDKFITEKRAILAQVDAGDLTNVAADEKIESLKNTLQQEVNVYRGQRAAIIRSQTEPTVQDLEERINSDLTLKNETLALANANPWLANVPERVIDSLKEEAIAALERMGKRIEPTPQSTLQLRQAMIAIAKTPAWSLDKAYGGVAVPRAADPGTKPTPEQLAQKLALQKNHPPLVAQAGADLPTAAEGLYDERTLGNMSESEMLAALPSSAVLKMLGAA